MRAAPWLAWIALACSCTQAPVAERCALEPLPVEWPASFPAPNEPPANRGTDLGRALGRRLFFDPQLSATGQVACATCHEAERAYSIEERVPTRGVTGRALARHAPVLLNLAWADQGLFWDGGAKNLESQALGPLLHADEMGRAASLPQLLRTLESDEQYRLCFDAVFGPSGLTLGHVARALAQFERSLISADTRWDRVRRGEAVFTPLEAAGERTFGRACARCHTPPLFTDDAFHSNGLDATFPTRLEDEARGRARISRNPNDLGKYRTPTLRGITRSAPYMHDGRFETLARVIEHYRSGMRDSPTLDSEFRREAEAPGVSLTDDEARALEAFLRTLD